jgi:hypothetical protein
MAKPKNKLSGGVTTFIHPRYLNDRIGYTYDVLLPEKVLVNELGDSSKSPFYLSITSEKSDSKQRLTTPNGELVPINGFAKYYPSYEEGTAMSVTGAFGVQGQAGLLVPESDEYKVATDPTTRLNTLKVRQFMVFMEYINELARIYKSDILKFIKRNIERRHPIEYNIDGTGPKALGPAEVFMMITRGEITESQAREMLDPVNIGRPIPGGLYGDIPVPSGSVINLPGMRQPTKTPEEIENTKKENKEYFAKIRQVNNTIYNSIRGQKIDDPKNPSLIIPSIFWFGGAEAIKLDTRTTLPESLFTELLALQKTFEKEIFNAKVPDILVSFKNNLKKLNDDFTKESELVATVNKANAGMPLDDSDKNKQLFEDEYQKQLRDDAKLTVLDTQNQYKDLLPGVSLPAEIKSAYEGSKNVWVSYKVRDIKQGGGKSAFQNWAIIFITSDEYKDFVKRSNIQVTNENILNDEAYAQKMNPTIDIKKLAETKSFYNSDVFESEDPDGLNIDLIDKLRIQEEEFNKTIADLKAPFQGEKDEIIAKNQESLVKLREKIGSVSGDMFKKLDDGMAVNKQNRIERQKQETERELKDSTKEDKDSALASLRNYQSCTSAKPPEETEPPERVFQDVNLQDIIAQSGRLLSGGRKKKNSVANQVYLLNKRYVDSNGFESPLVRTNSARKKGGAQVTTSVDPSLGVQGITQDELFDTSGLDKQMADMEFATNILDMADMAVGAIPIVGDLFSAGIAIANLVMADEIRKKEAEKEARRIENERLLDSWYKWKDDMIDQLVTTLSGQEDPEIYKKMKEKAIETFRTIDKSNPPGRREVIAFSKTLDAERDVFINQRKAITDQMSQNSEEIVDVIADVLQQQDDERSTLIEEGNAERMKVIDGFTTQLKDYIKKFVEDQGKLDEEEKRADEQAEKVADKIEEKQEELEDDAEDIAGLKGYSACKTSAKSAEQLRAEALQELEDEQDDLEEAQAQGTAPKEGLGKRYKKYNKNSIANQIYLLNMKYIKSF